MGQKKKLQWVWPKDGRQGRRPRGFYGGLRDIIQNKGPDMFLQEKGNGAIPLDHWSNWQAIHDEKVTWDVFADEMCRDSYHHPVYHQHEEEGSHLNGLFGASRGNQRYDPNTRRYTEWSIDRDWWGERINDENQAFYPRFTQDESQRILRRLQRHKNITPRSMGSEWKTDGPKVRQILRGSW